MRPQTGITEPVANLEETVESMNKIFEKKFKTVLITDRINKPIFIPKHTLNVWWSWGEETVKRVCKIGDPIHKIVRAVYAVGETISAMASVKKNQVKSANTQWFKENKAQELKLRKWIGLISNELSQRSKTHNTTRKRRQALSAIKGRFGGIKSTDELRVRLEQLKQQLLLQKSKTVAREKVMTRSRIRAKSSKEALRGDSLPALSNIEKVREYWEGIIGTEGPDTDPADIESWLHNVNLPEQCIQIDKAVWTEVVKKAKGRKAPGPDGVPNILWKKLKSANKLLYHWISQIVDSKLKVPRWMVRGRIILLFKGGDPEGVGNYRPIACLNTCYKLLTSVLTKLIGEHVRGVIPASQLAIQPGIWGCTHAHILDRALVRDATHGRKKEISMAWIDYAKAFDSIPHKYILSVLGVLKVHPHIVYTLKSAFRKFEVRYTLKSENRQLVSNVLKVKRGVLQGDSLSPLLFCIAIMPISYVLNEFPMVPIGNQKINHIYYMDDLKLYSDSKEGLKAMIQTVRTTAGKIGLRMNEKKCAIVQTCITDEAEGVDGIPVLNKDEVYKYLGVEECTMAKAKVGFERVAEEMLQRTEKLWSMDRTARQAVNDFNGAVIPVAKYLFINLIDSDTSVGSVRIWSREFDHQIRKVAAKANLRYKVGSVDRLYLKTSLGGIGLTSLEDTLLESVVYAWCYLTCTPDLQNAYMVYSKMKQHQRKSIIVDAERIMLEFNVDGSLFPEQGEDPTSTARKIIRIMRDKKNQQRFQKWKDLQKAGAVCRDEQVNWKLSSLWLAKAAVSKLVFRNAVAVQEQCLYTRTLAKEENGLCRRCGKAQETVQHVVAGCEYYRASIMLTRHNAVCGILYREACRKYDLPYVHYTQTIPGVSENERVKILYDVNIATKFEIKHNRPDIIVFDKREKTITIIEVSVSWYTCLHFREQYKYNRYAVNSMHNNPNDEGSVPDRNLKEMINLMYAKEYNQGTKVIPIIVGCTGEVSHHFEKYIKEMNLICEGQVQHLIEKLQRAAVTHTSLLVRAHLNK